MTKAGAIAILTTIFLGLSGWTMSEVAELKERVKGNEVSKESLKVMLLEIKTDQKEMNQKIDKVLEQLRAQ